MFLSGSWYRNVFDVNVAFNSIDDTIPWKWDSNYYDVYKKKKLETQYMWYNCLKEQQLEKEKYRY